MHYIYLLPAHAFPVRFLHAAGHVALNASLEYIKNCYPNRTDSSIILCSTWITAG